MVHYFRESKTLLLRRGVSAVITFTFLFTSIITPAYAQNLSFLNLPPLGAMVNVSPAFMPVVLKGMTVHPENPLQFDFIIDSGNTGFKSEQIKQESERLVKYFLAAMTVPQDDLWVNLSPYEQDRIIPEELGKTELGRDMLAQDYLLKQVTASMIYPEQELGKKFWDKIYVKAQERFGTTEIPINTFNKVWIMPDKAEIYEHDQTVYIVNSRLKVMLDEDYLALQNNAGNAKLGIDRMTKDQLGDTASLSSQIVREIVLPELEREVNEGKNFALIRQIYHSLILAQWYKETVKESLLSKVYIDQKKVKGVDLDDPTLKDQIYAHYVAAFKQGVFDYIKEDYDRLSQEAIPRKYFSGGEQMGHAPLHRVDGTGVSDAALNQATVKIEAQQDVQTEQNLAGLGAANDDTDEASLPNPELMGNRRLSEAELRWVREPGEENGFQTKHIFNRKRVIAQIEKIKSALDGTDYTNRQRPEDENLRDMLMRIDPLEVIKWVKENPSENYKDEEVQILDGVGLDARVIGRLDRKVAEHFGFPHETANIIMVTPSGKVILQLRNSDRFDDHLGMYGGHLKIGETHLEGAVKETLEETGLAYLDYNPAYVGMESYDVDGDFNKERRSWFVKVLTDREFANLEIELDALQRVYKDKLARPQAKALLTKVREAKRDGSGEVIGLHFTTFDEIAAATTKPYKEGVTPATTPFETKPVRYLEVTDWFNGQELTTEASFTPDSFDRLVSNTRLFNELREAVSKSRKIIAGIAQDLIDRDIRDDLTVATIQKALEQDNVIVLNSGIGKNQEALANEVANKVKQLKSKSATKEGLVIVLAGGGGTGKSTTASAIAKERGAKNIYVGLIYRALALMMIQAGIAANPEAVAKALEEKTEGSAITRADEILRNLELVSDENSNPSITYNGADITQEIDQRRVEIEKTLSAKAWSKNLHEKIKDKWIATIEEEVASGRDVVVDMRPTQAELINSNRDPAHRHTILNVYLTADILVRAGRRANDAIGTLGLDQAYEAYGRNVQLDENDTAIETVLAPFYNNRARVSLEAQQYKVDEIWNKALNREDAVQREIDLGGRQDREVRVLSPDFYEWVRAPAGEGDRTTVALFRKFVEERIPAEWIENLKAVPDVFIELFPGPIELSEGMISQAYPDMLSEDRTRLRIEQLYKTSVGGHTRYVVANLPGRSTIEQMVAFLKFMGVPHNKILINAEPSRQERQNWYELLLGARIEESDAVVFMPVFSDTIPSALIWDRVNDIIEDIPAPLSSLANPMRVNNRKFGWLLRSQGRNTMVLNIRAIFGESARDFVEWLQSKAEREEIPRLRKMVFYGTAGAYNSTQPGARQKKANDIIVPDRVSMDYFDSVFGSLLTEEVSFENRAALQGLSVSRVNPADSRLAPLGSDEREEVVNRVGNTAVILPQPGRPVLNATTANVGTETARTVRQWRGSGVEASDMELSYLVRGIQRINALPQRASNRLELSALLMVTDIPATKDANDAHIRSRSVPVDRTTMEIISENVYMFIKSYLSGPEALAHYLGEQAAAGIDVQSYRENVGPLLQNPADDIKDNMQKNGPEAFPFMNAMGSKSRYKDPALGSILEHTLDIMSFAQMLGNGKAEDFNGGHAGWEMSQELVNEYRAAYPLDKRDKELLNIFILMHDIAVLIQDSAHAELGAIIAKPILEKMGLNEDEVNLISWLIYHHVDLGTIFTGERSARVIIKALNDLPERMRDKAKIFLALQTIGEMRDIKEGNFLQQKNSEFYLHTMQGGRLDALDQTFDAYRMQMYSSGDNNILKEERSAAVLEQIGEIPRIERQQFDETLRTVITTIDYGVYFFRRLEPDALIKMFYLFSQIEKDNGNKLSRLNFTAPSTATDGPAAAASAILRKYTFSDLTVGSGKFRMAKEDLNITVEPENGIILCDNKGLPKAEDLGGIDMNLIGLQHQGVPASIEFDPVEIQSILQNGVEGFAPVIINLTPLSSVLPLLGLEPQEKEPGKEPEYEFTRAR